MAVRIEDVAEAAGVSMKTVSRVINGEPHVRPVLRDRVLASMTVLGYSPNIAARRLASNAAFSIGLLFGGAPGEYFHQIILSILTHSMRQGYTLLVADFTPFDPQSRMEVNGLVKRRHTDGLILTPPCDNDTELLAQLNETGIPFVRLTPADTTSPLPYVSADDKQGAYEMTRYLIGLGHRRIGFVSGDPNHHASVERFQGFQTALSDNNLPLERAWVRQADFLFEKGITAGRELLSLRERPTAIFAGNDESAEGVLIAAHELGVRIPAELSVAGFDDFPSARKTFPALSTVRQNMQEISAQATKLLLDIINKREPEALHIRIPATLVIRDSTARCSS